MSLPKVSIIIPYNVDRGYLHLAVESVKNQTYKGEIELIHSCSDNNVSYNLNVGIKQATGELIKYLCDDDTLTPNSIEDSVNAIKGFDFVHGVANNCFENGLIITQRPKLKYPTLFHMVTNNVIHGGSLMYRRDVFDKVGYFNEDLVCAEEYEFNMRCLKFGLKLGYCDSILYNYRRHDKQKSLGKGIDQVERKRRIEAIQNIYKRDKIVIGIATFKGREKHLEQTIKTLRNQCDEIVVYDNEVNEDLTDNGKFYGLTIQKSPCYYITCDDDILYPHDYVQRIIESIDKYKCIVSFHGRILKGLDLNYYHGHDSFAFNKQFSNDIDIDVCGTGVTGFHTNYFNPINLIDSKYQRMSDIIFSLEAIKQGKNIKMLKRHLNYIQQQPIDYSQTIAGTSANNCEVQTKLTNEIWTLKH